MTSRIFTAFVLNNSNKKAIKGRGSKVPAGLPNETELGLVNFLDISVFDLD
jgi:hypothetical protein